MSHIEKEEDSVEGDTSEETQPNETSLHRDLVRQLLEDRDLNLVTKYSLWKEVKAEYDDDVRIDEQSVYSEIDSYIHQQRLEKRKNSGNTSNSRAKRVKGGYDTVFLVDEALQQITGRSECTSREILYSVWKYIHDNQLIQSEDSSLINMDTTFQLLEERDTISIHEVTGILRNHVKLPGFTQLPTNSIEEIEQDEQDEENEQENELVEDE